MVLHGLLLLTPVPPPPPPEEVEPEEDEFVDLLNIQSLTPPEPEVPEPPPPTQAPPPPAQTIPSNQPALPQPEAASPPPEQTLAEAPLPPDPTTPEAPTPAAPAAFVADEAAEIFSRLTRGSGESDFDATATSFPYAAYSIPRAFKSGLPRSKPAFLRKSVPKPTRLCPPLPRCVISRATCNSLKLRIFPAPFPHLLTKSTQLAAATVADLYFRFYGMAIPTCLLQWQGLVLGLQASKLLGWSLSGPATQDPGRPHYFR
ncbi:MAG: hypothetical protein HC929_17170 [Leptolyngbyaceae cyanobacterium SM2_5_2]|nr:hypothetical protein [Leptolyngbyaceae cyanobacterium SM2_5_2]